MTLPVTILTGFLGSGKSTLLNRLLRAPEMSDAAVIINEFGEIPIDHLLVESAIENATVLQNGCICCTIRGDLVDTLLDLEAKRAKGDIPPFRRVAIETTGLADAAPILHTLLYNEEIAGRYAVGSVVTTVDAANLLTQLPRFPETRRQIAFASVVALTKTDLVDGAKAENVRAAIHAINPAPRILTVVNGNANYTELLSGAGTPDEAGLRDWLAADAYAPVAHHDHEHDHAHAHSHHADDIHSCCATWEAPLDLARFRRWLLAITSLRGANLLRVKGVVNIAGIEGPVVIQGVQHVLYPPVQLPAWPDADRRSRIVFITQGLAPDAILSSLGYLD
jgi:G3E family GTPase